MKSPTDTPKKVGVGLLLTAGIPFATLILSALGVYFTYFRQVDDLTAVIHQMPSVGVLSKSQLFIEGTLSFTLTNSGTRSVEVDNIEIEVRQKRSGDGINCNQGGTDFFYTDIQSFAVKAGESVAKTVGIKFVPEKGRAKVGVNRILFLADHEVMLEDSGLIVQVCFLFDISTAQRQFQREIDFGDYAIDKRQGYMEVDRPIEDSESKELVHEGLFFNW